MNIRNYIVQGARKRGLDPAAALAVASVEGGFGGAIGDQGTSFGPFQLHEGGALPHGRGSRWANSPAGIDYALNQMAQVARGKHGRAAVDSIVRRFERPAAPDAEVQKAFSRYRQVGGGEAGASASSVPAAGQAPAPGKPLPGKHELAMQLVSMLGSNHPDVQGLIPLVAAAKAQPHVDKRMVVPAGPQAQPRSRGPAAGAAAAGAASSQDAAVVASAKKWLGTPYVFGGTSKSGIDCSALLQRIWGDAGVKIARTTYDQWKQGHAVGKGQLRAGDAVFFRGSDAHGNLPGHVGVYIGHGKFIEAAHTGTNVRVSKLAGRSDYVGARRYG